MKNRQKTLFFWQKASVGVKIFPKFKWGYQSEVSRDHLVKIAGIYGAPSARLKEKNKNKNIQQQNI